jgi:hypothetical protein
MRYDSPLSKQQAGSSSFSTTKCALANVTTLDFLEDKRLDTRGHDGDITHIIHHGNRKKHKYGKPE